MGASFWVKRFVVVLASAWAIISSAQLLQGESLAYSASQGLLWAAISASIFTGARIYQSRKKQHCALCRDTPEMVEPARGDEA